MNPFNNNRKNAKSNLKPDELIRIIKKANANWKVKDNYLEAFSTMPDEFYSIIDASAEQKIIAESKYQAEKYGIDDYAAYTSLKNIESLGNKLLRDKEFIGKSLAPFLQSEMGPLIENEVQETLRSSASYWDMVSKVPLGNGEEIQMDTEFIVRDLDRIQNLVKMDLYDKNTDCYIFNSSAYQELGSNTPAQISVGYYDAIGNLIGSLNETIDPTFGWATYDLFQTPGYAGGNASIARISISGDGVVLDNLSFVPEPASSTLLLAGLGMLAGVARRRRTAD